MERAIEITGSTRVYDLLNLYPYLRMELPKLHEKFKRLNAPFAGVLIQKATVADMSSRTGMDEDALIRGIEGLIRE